MDTARTGIIPEAAPRYSDRPGEAYFRDVRLTDLTGQHVSQLYSRPAISGPLSVCDVMKEITAGHLEVGISTPDGI